MAAAKCVHKGCGKTFTDPDEPCVYHPGPPEFHEGQKGWKCCKPRFLTFDEFLNIPPCTTGKHSSVDDTPKPAPPPAPSEDAQPAPPPPKPISSIAINGALSSRPAAAAPTPARVPAPAPESESDDPSLEIAPNTTCRRRGCKASHDPSVDRSDEECVYHVGHALFHEGSKGWTCCKRRVLEFEEFMKIEGCKKKKRHLFIGKGRVEREEKVLDVRNDFYQTPTTVIASFYLKKIDKAKAKVEFSSPTALDLDLPTSDNKRYVATIPLFASIDQKASQFKIMGTKLELTLVKTDGSSWPVLRSDDTLTGEIIQVGRPGRA